MGRAYCERDGTRLRLGGVNVEGSVPAPRAGRLAVLRPRWLQPADGPPPLRPRGHGIGAAILAEVIREADALGVEEIWGCVTARDLLESPFLLEFYQRRGFGVAPADGECAYCAAELKITRRARP